MIIRRQTLILSELDIIASFYQTQHDVTTLCWFNFGSLSAIVAHQTQSWSVDQGQRWWWCLFPCISHSKFKPVLKHFRVSLRCSVQAMVSCCLSAVSLIDVISKHKNQMMIMGRSRGTLSAPFSRWMVVSTHSTGLGIDDLTWFSDIPSYYVNGSDIWPENTI